MHATTNTTNATIAALKKVTGTLGGLINLDTEQFGRVRCGVSHVVPIFNNAYAVIWFYDADGVHHLERVYADKVTVVG